MTMGVCDTTGRVLGINIISNAKDNVKHYLTYLSKSLEADTKMC